MTRRQREQTGRGVTISPAPLPALPQDVLGRIARAVLDLEGSDAQAWARLSLVCRAWRESLRGGWSIQLMQAPVQRRLLTRCRGGFLSASSLAWSISLQFVLCIRRARFVLSGNMPKECHQG